MEHLAASLCSVLGFHLYLQDAALHTGRLEYEWPVVPPILGHRQSQEGYYKHSYLCWSVFKVSYLIMFAVME